MENTDNLDPLLEQMVKKKLNMNKQGNTAKNNPNSNNRISNSIKTQNQKDKKPKKVYIEKSTLKKETQTKYIAKDSLKKNQPEKLTSDHQNKSDLTQQKEENHRDPETFHKSFRVGHNYEPYKTQKSSWEDTRPLEVKPERKHTKIPQIKEEYQDSFQSKYSNMKSPEQKKYEKPQRPNQNKKREVKTEYKNICDKYTKNCQKLQEREQELGIEIKKLKKFFLESDFIRMSPKKPTEISVMKCLDSPVIFFEYNYEGEKRYMALREVCKGLADKNKLGDYHEIVKKIYDTHYFPVDLAYEKALFQFVKLKAADIQIKLALNKKTDLPTSRKQTHKMFYYWLNQYNYIHFIFFDYMMRGIEFAEKYINQNKHNVDEETFRTFEKFSQQVKAKDETEMVNFGEEEVESQHSNQSSDIEEEDLDIFKKCFSFKNRLDELLNTDISEIQSDLELKNKEHLELLINQSTETQKIDKLGDDIEKISTILENFKLVKEEIQHQLRRIKLKREYTKSDLEFFTLSLKRMVFARKQLDSDLPILGKKREIFDLLDKHNLIILEGETGSGKSTQLPQMLCEYYKLFQNPKALPVLVTQPRKIATRSLAERVADELEEKGGTFVDYVASGTKVANPKAKIVFKLDRLVLDELVESPTLDAYSCLVIDEAHERTISIDVILGLVKELLKKRDGFKVIITSASMEIALFEKYFQMKTLKVSGRMYPVNIRYLPSKEEDMVKKIEKAIDTELLTERNMLKDKYKGHILVFCADTAEIEALSEIFRRKLNHNVFMVIPLHGKLTPEDQKKAFSKTKEHKLIFASRIAETAITIDGVKVVIDPGWDREMQYDQKTKFSSMKLVQISQSSAKQRAGRAGRTQEGFCLRLYSEDEFSRRRFNKLPEIKNIALETLVLRLKTLGINNVSSFDYIERPDEEGMKTSIETLKMIGCLDEKESITSIGKFLVKIPIEPFLARAIIEGLLMQAAIQKNKIKTLESLNLTESIIEILCMVLNAGNLFRIQENFRQLAEKMKFQKFSHEKGDFFFLKKIYDQFKQINYYNRQQLNRWLTSHFLIKKTLIQVKELVKEIQSILKQFRVDEHEMKEDLLKCKIKLQKYEKAEDRILSCLTTSFAANLCLFSGHAQIGYTYMNMEKLLTIYGTSSLSLLGICPKWILAYDFYENKDGKLYCKVANEIDYEFLKSTVEDYVYEKYRIDKLEKRNPFYKPVSYSLETLVMLFLKEYYETREYRTQKELQFLKTLNLNFSESENNVTAFIKCDQSQEQNKQLIETQLQRLIDQIKRKAMSPYNHNYIGNIFVLMGNGFEIQKIEFKSTQTVFEVSGLDEDTFNQINNDWQPVTYIETFGKNKIKLYFDNEEIITNFNSYLDYCKDKENKNLFVRVEIADIRKKIPQTKIYLHWFAGKSLKNNILIKFAFEFDRNNSKTLTEQEVQQITSRQYAYLLNVRDRLTQKKLKSQRQQRLNRMRARGLMAQIDQPNVNQTFTQEELKLYMQSGQLSYSITKSGNGINVFTYQMDEIDLYRFYTSIISTNNVDPNFQLPKLIKKFREPERPHCEIKDAEWIEKIQKMLEKVTDKNEPCIRVWGTGIRKGENQKLSQLEKTYRIQMKAEIKTFDCNLLSKLKAEYDGKLQVLGCQKLHVSSMFSQSVIAVGLRAFEYLKQEFDYNIDNFRQQFPGLIVDIFVRQVRRNSKKSKVFITISSENREHLLKPVRILNSLFTPKYITLLDSEYRYLNNHEGDKVLQEMEAAFDYKIHFGFDKAQRRLKLYCHDSLENDIKNMLKKKLSEITYHDQIISYRGKNLKKIEKLLQEKQQEIEQHNRISQDQKFLAFEIRFTSRSIKIMADLDTFYAVKRKIMDLKNKVEENKCPVCEDQMLTPYKLFNCGHSFCWFCLQNVVKEFKSGHISQLKCPHYDENEIPCNKFINIYDVMKILSEQELQQIFDVKISKYVDEHPDKYERCLSADCEQIFEKDTLNNECEIDCRLCGKYYCLKCKESHKNFTCQQWKSRFDLTDKLMEKIGVKRCKKCQNGIQKNGGCKHVTCKCGAHICWDCLEVFQTSKQCCDHLVKQHGGIFGPNYNNQDW